MKKTKQAMTLAVMAMLAGVVGCGDDKDDKKDTGSNTNNNNDDNNNDDNNNDSGGGDLPTSKKLLELTADEAQSLCAWFNDKLGDIGGTETQYCTSDAVAETTTSDDCTDYVQQCIDDGSYAGDESLNCDEFEIEYQVGSDCEATVSELQKCINAQVPLERAALEEPTCSKPGEDHSYDLPEACETLYDKCPGFYGE